MRKVYFVAALLSVAIVAKSQRPYEGTKFYDNWSIGINGGVTTPTTGGAFFDGFRPTFGLELTKQITPVFGLGVQGMAVVDNDVESSTAIDVTNISLLGKVNMNNLFFHAYAGKPKFLEIEGVAGVGWGHNYFKRAFWGKNYVSSKFGLNINFNIGQKRAWTVALKPSIVYNLNAQSQESPNMPTRYNVNHSEIELLAGITYHFKNSNGHNYITLARLYDQGEVDALNAKINDFRQKNRKSQNELRDFKGRVRDLQQQLNDCRSQKPLVERIVVDRTHQTMESVVTFRQGSSTVEASQLPNVERIATYMKNHSEANVIIKGYASPEGSVEVNGKIAFARAMSVKNILINRYRISESRITAEGQGIGNMFSEPDWNRVSICTLVDEAK